MITEHAKEEIRGELREEGFDNVTMGFIRLNVVENALRWIIFFIKEYREGDYIFYKREVPGIVKRLVEKYSSDNYQVKEAV